MHTSIAVAVSVLCLLVTACATKPSSDAAAFVDKPPSDGTGVIYVGRPDAPDVSVVPLQLEINGRPLVSIGPNQYTRIEVLPGTYRLAAADVYLTWITYGTPTPVELDTKAGVRYFVQPRSWAGRPQFGVGTAGKLIIPTITTAQRHGTLHVYEKDVGEAAPVQFNGLVYVAPNGGEVWKP